MIKLRFIGGKQAPGKPYEKNKVYDLPPRYESFPWFQRVGSKAIAQPPQQRGMSLGTPTTPGEDKEFEDAFKAELGSLGITNVAPLGSKKEEKTVTPQEVSNPLEGEVTEAKLQKMTKTQIVQLIKAKGGVADESMLKAVLVQAALSMST